jgi:hypothetical protein
MPATLVLTDPTEAPRYPDSPLSRWCQRALHDPRDEVFVRLTLRVVATMAVAQALLWAAWRHDVAPLLASVAYAGLALWLLAPVILMLHNTMHRRFLRSSWLSAAHPLVMTFFFGIPTGYAPHHLAMHHVEDNAEEDLSSTMRYRRDSFAHFLVYFFRFLLLGLPEVSWYLIRRGRFRPARKLILGELAHIALVVSVCAYDWRLGVVAFLGPTLVVRFAMMAGNWGQHAFLNTERPNDGFANAFTCINSGYNQRAFNDGYHIGHHRRQGRHWTEMPQELLDRRAEYAAADAVIFEGLDSFLVAVLLWTGQWRLLARRFVRLEGRERSDDEVIALLKARVRPVRAWPTDARPHVAA